TPLPAANDIRLDAENLSAYRVCLEFEARSLAGEFGDAGLRHARVLGYLILHAPSSAALHELCTAIHACNEDYSQLSDLGEIFTDYFVRAFKKYRGTPTPRSHPSRPSFDSDNSRLLDSITTAPTSYAEAKKQALIRDNFRCVVTGKYDLEAPVDPRIIIAAGYGLSTELAYIMPEYRYFDLNKDPEEKDYSASVFAVLKCFGYDVIQLDGDRVHSLFNVMTMSYDYRDHFNRLRIWFERTNTPNCYTCQTCMEIIQVPDMITFTTPDATKLPLPRPELLALHGTCAKVAHLSGAGEYVDRILKDLETVDELAADGTSSDLLYHALALTSHHVVTTNVAPFMS
ncbi:hypothetical protein DL96DRAFT_1595805, partial [Flagelloscypha sp. PMI_526]